MAIDVSILQSNDGLILFLFVVAIIFGVLDLTRIFRNRGVNLLISIAISYFTVTNPVFLAIIQPLMGSIAVFFIFMFFVAFVLKVFGLGGQKSAEEGMLINGAILLILFVFGFMHSNLIPELPFIGSGTNFIALIALVFIVVIFWLAFRAGEQPQAVQGRK